MRSILTLLITFLIYNVIAQNNEDWGVPYNEDEKAIIYENVIVVNGTSKDELFQRADEWVNTYFTNAAKKIYEKDQNAGTIKLKDRVITYSINKKQKAKDAMIDYKLEIYVKEGRYKYKIHNFRSFQGSVAPPLEKWMDPTFMESKEAKRKFALLHAEIEKLIVELNAGMEKNNKSEEDDW